MMASWREFIGDGVLVYFGYPQAHEDDAERAVRAGLDIVAAMPSLRTIDSLELACRIGIASGVSSSATSSLSARRPDRPHSAKPLTSRPACKTPPLATASL